MAMTLETRWQINIAITQFDFQLEMTAILSAQSYNLWMCNSSECTQITLKIALKIALNLKLTLPLMIDRIELAVARTGGGMWTLQVKWDSEHWLDLLTCRWNLSLSWNSDNYGSGIQAGVFVAVWQDWCRCCVDQLFRCKYALRLENVGRSYIWTWTRLKFELKYLISLSSQDGEGPIQITGTE